MITEQNKVQSLIDRINPIVLRVQSIVGRVKGMVWVYAGSGAVLWGILFLPFSGNSAWVYGFAALVLIGLLLPSVILLLFYLGLQTVIGLPGRLLEKAGIGETHARAMLETARLSNKEEPSRKVGKLLGTLYEMRSLVLDSKGMLFEYAALVRLANPLVLGIVGIAVVAGFFILVGALIGLVIIGF